MNISPNDFIVKVGNIPNVFTLFFALNQQESIPAFIAPCISVYKSSPIIKIDDLSLFLIFLKIISKNLKSGLFTPIFSDTKKVEKYLDNFALSSLGFCSESGPLLAITNSQFPYNFSKQGAKLELISLEEYSNGDIISVELKNGTQLIRTYVESGDNVILIPANQDFETLTIPKKDIEIKGKVKSYTIDL